MKVGSVTGVQTCALPIFDSMKSESLVIVDQNATVNTFPGLVHRPSHHGSGLQKK